MQKLLRYKKLQVTEYTRINFVYSALYVTFLLLLAFGVNPEVYAHLLNFVMYPSPGLHRFLKILGDTSKF
jgi:fumarate reductase subunit C